MTIRLFRRSERFLRKRYTSVWLLLVAIPFLLITGMLVYTARGPALLWFREKRVAALLKEADGLVKAGNPRTARDRAEAAHLLDPDSIDSLRLLVALNPRRTKENLRETLAYSSKLIARQAATDADRKAHAALLVEDGQFVAALQTLSPLMARDGNDRDNLRACLRLLILSGTQGRAFDLLAASQPLLPMEKLLPVARELAADSTGWPVTQVPSADPAKARRMARLYLGVILLRSSWLEHQTEGAEILFALGDDPDEIHRAALRALLANSSTSRVQIRRAMALLESHPLARPEDLLATQTARIILEPAKRERFVEQAIARFSDPPLPSALGQIPSAPAAPEPAEDASGKGKRPTLAQELFPGVSPRKSTDATADAKPTPAADSTPTKDSPAIEKPVFELADNAPRVALVQWLNQINASAFVPDILPSTYRLKNPAAALARVTALERLGRVREARIALTGDAAALRPFHAQALSAILAAEEGDMSLANAQWPVAVRLAIGNDGNSDETSLAALTEMAQMARQRGLTNYIHMVWRNLPGDVLRLQPDFPANAASYATWLRQNNPGTAELAHLAQARSGLPPAPPPASRM